MHMKHTTYSILTPILLLFIYNCSSGASKTADLSKPNQIQIENNKVKVSVEQQKNKIVESLLNIVNLFKSK